MLKVLAFLLCRRVERDDLSGTMDAIGIYEETWVDELPGDLDFTFLVRVYGARGPFKLRVEFAKAADGDIILSWEHEVEGKVPPTTIVSRRFNLKVDFDGPGDYKVRLCHANVTLAELPLKLRVAPGAAPGSLRLN